MTPADFEYLCSPEARRLIGEHIGRDPLELALALKNPLVTQQVELLQKARTKLPSYYDARCVLTRELYEQASSEATACARTFPSARPGTSSGGTDEGAAHGEAESAVAWDLTCGLGVDTLALSRHYRQVAAVERDPLKAAIARENFARLGAGNITIVCSGAETFAGGGFLSLAPELQRPALIYLDPSRRSADGRRAYAIENCEPNLAALLPALRAIARHTARNNGSATVNPGGITTFPDGIAGNPGSIPANPEALLPGTPAEDPPGHIIAKLSPMLDVDELLRLFPEAAVEVVSADNECREVLLKFGFETSGKPLQITILPGGTGSKPLRLSFARRANAIRPGQSTPETSRETLGDAPGTATSPRHAETPILNEMQWLHNPDVALVKSRTVEAYIADHYPGIAVLPGEYLLSAAPLERFAGRSLRIAAIWPWKPRDVARLLKERGIRTADIHRRGFAESAEKIARTLGIRQGGTAELWLTTIGGEAIAVLTEKCVRTPR